MRTDERSSALHVFSHFPLPAVVSLPLSPLPPTTCSASRTPVHQPAQPMVSFPPASCVAASRFVSPRSRSSGGLISLLALVVVCALALFVTPAEAVRRRPTKMSNNPVSTQYTPEPHHSLHAPMDTSQSYFTFGGSTVATKKYMRLTPSTQDRKGFVWNEYPMESDDFEVEVKLEIFSTPHFGGDGMGIWFLNAEQDPSVSSEPSALQVRSLLLLPTHIAPRHILSSRNVADVKLS